MAKVKFGSGVADIRGHIGGTVFSRNGSGAYMREKVSPVNPNSPRQAEIRGRLTSLSKVWATLNFGLRKAWTNFATNHPVTDVFGNQVTLSGIAMFQRVNGVVLNLSSSVLTTPPPSLEIPDVENVVFSAAGGDTTLEVSYSPAPAQPNLFAYSFLAGPHSAGKSFVKNLLRFFNFDPIILAQIATSFNGPARFGTFISGATYTATMSYASSSTGAVSTPAIGTFVAL